jgi:hypothetical protein
VNEGQNGLDIGTLIKSIRKRYVHRQADVHIHLQIAFSKIGSLHPGHYCLCFYCGDGTDELDGMNRLYARKCEATEMDGGCMEQSVFVEIGQMCQLPKLVTSEIGAQLVRLQFLDDCLRLWVESINSRLLTLEHLRAAAALSLPVFIPNDGELGMLCDLIREHCCVVIGDRQSKDQAIKRATLMVENLTSDQRKRLQGDSVSTGFEQDYGRVIRITFKPRAAMVIADEPIHGSLLQLHQVLYRPFEFQDVAVLLGRHGGLLYAIGRNQFPQLLTGGFWSFRAVNKAFGNENRAYALKTMGWMMGKKFTGH